MVAYALCAVAALLALSPIAVAASAAPRGARAATSLVYGACLIITLILGAIALFALYRDSATTSVVTLPLGLP